MAGATEKAFIPLGTQPSSYRGKLREKVVLNFESFTQTGPATCGFNLKPRMNFFFFNFFFLSCRTRLMLEDWRGINYSLKNTHHMKGWIGRHSKISDSFLEGGNLIIFIQHCSLLYRPFIPVFRKVLGRYFCKETWFYSHFSSSVIIQCIKEISRCGWHQY